MGKPGRPVLVELGDRDREAAALNLKRVAGAWQLGGADLAILLETTAGVISALRNARPVASSKMVAKALALDDANVAISELITQRKIRAQKLAAHLDHLRQYNAAMNAGLGWPPKEPGAEVEPTVEREGREDPAEEDKDIPFT